MKTFFKGFHFKKNYLYFFIISILFPLVTLSYTYNIIISNNYYAYLGNDTHVTLYAFKTIYDNFYRFSELPLWNPYFLSGQTLEYWYYMISGIDFFYILIGKAISQDNLFKLYLWSINTHIIIGAIGFCLLFKKLRFPWVIIFFLIGTYLLSVDASYWITFLLKNYYLFPFFILFSYIFVFEEKNRGLIGLFISWSAFLFGNLPHICIFQFYIVLFLILILLFYKWKKNYEENKIRLWKFYYKNIKETFYKFKNPYVFLSLIIAIFFSLLYFSIISGEKYLGNLEIFRAGRDENLSIPFLEYINAFSHESNSNSIFYLLEILYDYLSLKNRRAFNIYVGPFVLWFIFYSFDQKLTVIQKGIILFVTLWFLAFFKETSALILSLFYYLPGMSYVRPIPGIYSILIKGSFLILGGYGIIAYIANLTKNRDIKYSYKNIFSFSTFGFIIITISIINYTGLSFKTISIYNYYTIISLLLLVILPFSPIKNYLKFKNKEIFLLVIFTFNFCLTIFVDSKIYVEEKIEKYSYRQEYKKFYKDLNLIKDEILVKNFIPPSFREKKDLFDKKRQEFVKFKVPGTHYWGTHTLWLSGSGYNLCEPQRSAQTISKSLYEYFSTLKYGLGLNDSMSDYYYNLLIVEGSDLLNKKLKNNEYFNKSNGCSLPIFRFNKNPILVETWKEKNDLINSMVMDETIFNDVILNNENVTFKNTNPPFNFFPSYPNKEKVLSLFTNVNFIKSKQNHSLTKISSRIFEDMSVLEIANNESSIISLSVQNKIQPVSVFSGGSSIIGNINSGWQLKPTNKYDFKDEDWTIEWFSKRIGLIPHNQDNFIIDWVDFNNNRVSINLYNDKKVYLGKTLGELNSNILAPLNKWVHMAFQKKDNILYLLQDGKVIASAPDTLSYDFSKPKKYLSFNQSYWNDASGINNFVYNTEIRIAKKAMYEINKNTYIKPITTFANSALYKNAKLSNKKPIISKDGLNNIFIKRFSHNKIDLITNHNENSWLIYSDSYDKRWKVKIDKKNQDIFRVNVGFKAFMVPKGKKEIELIFEDKIMLFKLWLLMISSVILIPIFLWFSLKVLNRQESG